MAEAKKTVKVLVATFPSAHGDQAKKRLAEVEAAGLKDFKVTPADFPGYIQVAKVFDTKEAAEEALKEAKEKKINAVIA